MKEPKINVMRSWISTTKEFAGQVFEREDAAAERLFVDVNVRRKAPLAAGEAEIILVSGAVDVPATAREMGLSRLVFQLACGEAGHDLGSAIGEQAGKLNLVG